MLGHMHVTLRAMVLHVAGEQTWLKVLQTSKCDDNQDFMSFHSYSDAMMDKLVQATIKVIGINRVQLLEKLGEHFLIYCLQNGYDKLLRSLGENFESFITNLDSMHAMLAYSYRGMQAPSFRCQKMADGSIELHYYSYRPGLYPVVTGLLEAIGSQLFHIKVQSNVKTQEIMEMLNDQIMYHVTFEIYVYGEPKQTYHRNDEAEKQKIMSCVEEQHFSKIVTAKRFCMLFPYHLIFDDRLIIRQAGQGMQKLLFQTRPLGGHLSQFFLIDHPQVSMELNAMLEFLNASFVLRIKQQMYGGTQVKGQLVWLAENKLVIFIGSLQLGGLSEMVEKNLFLSDIPLHDVSRELIMLNHLREAEIDICKRLDETTSQLRTTAAALKEEKLKTDMLLYRMLPMKVANQLREGKSVEAEKYDEVTVLFSDIVTFTNIAALVTPIQIVDMLNNLFSKYDKLSTIHKVYKVETIGDAYMVVGGAPEIITDHAQRVSNMGLDMLSKTAEVKCPDSEKPIYIRVGIHTGPVVAGIVGDKMPRWCMFGDTVNTASRMESHGQPNKIHISHTTYQKLAKEVGYSIEKRGEINIKGKGFMTTYFLSKHSASDPNKTQNGKASTSLKEDSKNTGLSKVSYTCTVI